MYSSQDLERFYFQYQTEALPRGLSLQTFCLKNNVPYNLLHKWYKDTHGKIVEVQLEGVPPSLSVAQSSSVPSVPVASEGVGEKRLEVFSLPASAPAGCISVDLDPGQGLHVVQKNSGFIDMRCKHSRVLSVIREQLRREPSDGESNETDYRIDWKNIILLLESPVIKSLKIR